MVEIEKKEVSARKRSPKIEKSNILIIYNGPLLERERSPYLRTDKIEYENPPSMTNFKESPTEISKPIHINMRTNPLAVKMYRIILKFDAFIIFFGENRRRNYQLKNWRKLFQLIILQK